MKAVGDRSQTRSPTAIEATSLVKPRNLPVKPSVQLPLLPVFGTAPQFGKQLPANHVDGRVGIETGYLNRHILGPDLRHQRSIRFDELVDRRHDRVLAEDLVS